MTNQFDSMITNHVLSELVRASRSLTFWIQGQDAPVTILPAVDHYVGILVLGPNIMAGFSMKCTGTRIWLNIGSISRIDADPLQARENVSGQATTLMARVQEG
ncbi:MAG: hypothetical protein Q6370_012345 [Candidatus Sigynarchaeota archaeon]